jgi:hypothetical protein
LLQGKKEANALVEGGADKVVVLANEAATAGSTGVHARLSTRLGRAVLEGVTELAGVARVAGEDALLHVGNALGALNGHVAAVHVDKTGDVDGGVLTGVGEFTPGVADLSVDHLGILVESTPTTGSTSYSRNIEGATICNLVGDQRGNRVNPGSYTAPHNKDEVLARLVVEFGDIVAVVADPRSVTSRGRLGVLTSQAANSLEKGTEKTTLLDGGGLGNGGSTAEGQVGEKNGGEVETHLDG